MPQDSNKRLSEAFAARFTMLGRKIERARTLASRTEELLDAVACELADLRGMVRDSVETPLDNPIRRQRQHYGESSQGTGAVKLAAQPDGSAVAEIDGVGIPLPPYVAALMGVLMADNGFTTDHLVGWKSIVAIQFALKQRTRQSHSKEAVKNLVYHLRKRLANHGVSPLLVQHNRRLGYRFAVRRVSAAECDDH
jgi:hypothetical protein